ncbi:hypothetical protein QL285_062880 [Trifolium repens]|nr:hypothetical protein QL285_062880 [Trifolium repens]
MLPSTPISAIVAGKNDFQVRVRVLSLWIVPDRMKPTEDGTIQMLFLDDKCHKIQATVRKDLIPKYMDQLEEGSAYVFENFMVGSKDAFYKSIGHKYKLNFMTSTSVFKVTAPEIPRYHFDFVPFSEILNATDESRLVDVIGHVVEKVTNLTLKDLEMDDTERESTEGVTEITEPIILNLSDDLLQTKRMTIEDLIESSEIIYVEMFWICYDVSIFCDKSGQPRTAVPRYKVHLQEIDSSGSTTFTLFDRVVSRVLGRSVQDLLVTMNQDLTYPRELDTFVDKRMLFKVDVTDANLFRNSRSYTGVDGDNVEAGCVELGSQAADKNDVVEGGDSTKDDMNTLGTPTSKNLGKRSIDNAESISDKDADGSAWSSSNKIQKLAPVKIEKMD